MDIKKLYVAILSKGWWRSEIGFEVLPAMLRTENVQITLRNPRKCWAVPHYNNRNIICRDFLQTDCDFLLMMDHDIVPLSNPAELVLANKDIIGMPAKIRQKGKTLNWSAYMKHPDKKEYAPVDFARVDSTVDLLKLNERSNMGAVGTGCILIKREVLEKLKPPYFLEEIDENGIVTTGEDFYFSQKADKAGFEIFTTPRRLCEHFHETGLYDILSYEDSDGYFERRESIVGKKCIIGTGSGRCGTLSLAHLLNYQHGINCTHESNRWQWNFDEVDFMIYFPKIFSRNNFGKIPADVASWYLPYVEYMIQVLKLDLKVICLKRDLEATKRSWLSVLKNTNHWTDIKSSHWDSSQDGNNVHRDCFPKYDLPKEQAIQKYLYDYYNYALALQEKYPNQFKIFDTENLNSQAGIYDILEFAGIKENEMRFIKVHKNKS
jgi:hypothetical protein